MKEAADIEVLYTGTEPLSVKLRDGRLAEFTPEKPLRKLPFADASDLLSPAINGGRFRRPAIPSAFPPPDAPAAAAPASPPQSTAPSVPESVPVSEPSVPVAKPRKPRKPRQKKGGAK